MISSQKRSFESMYKVRVIVDGQAFVSSDFKSPAEAEEDVFRKAFEACSNKQSSFALKQSDISSFAGNNFKNVLISQLKEVSVLNFARKLNLLFEF
jgi:hypothetical protein